MTEWKPGDRVQYNDYGSKFTAVLIDNENTSTEHSWWAVVDSIQFIGDNCEGLKVGDKVIVVFGHSVKIEEGEN